MQMMAGALRHGDPAVETLVGVLEANLSSIDAERTALSPYARGALGAILRAFKALEMGTASQREQAAEVRLAEWETAFPGAEPSEVAQALADEREQHAALAEEFLGRVTTDRDSLHSMNVSPSLRDQLQAVVDSHKRRVAGPVAPEEPSATL